MFCERLVHKPSFISFYKGLLINTNQSDYRVSLTYHFSSMSQIRIYDINTLQGARILSKDAISEHIKSFGPTQH